MTSGSARLTQRRSTAQRLVRARLRPRLERALRGARQARDAHWTDCYGANVSFPRETLLELGGVSTDLPAAKDFDLGYRLCRGRLHAALPARRPRRPRRPEALREDARRRPAPGDDARRAGDPLPRGGRRRCSTGTPAPARARSPCGGPRSRLRVPPRPLAWVGGFLPGDGRKMIWLHFVRRFAFWRGVRSSLTRHSWVMVTHDQVIEAIAEMLQ